MAKSLAEFEGRSEALVGKFGFIGVQMGESAEVESVGLSPSIAAVGGNARSSALRASPRRAFQHSGTVGIYPIKTHYKVGRKCDVVLTGTR